MEKKFRVTSNEPETVTKEEAIVIASRKTAKYPDSPYFIYQVIAKVESAVPTAVVTEIT